MNVLVTGVTGAIGSELVPLLAGAGHAVRGFARDPARVTVGGLAAVVRGDAVAGDGLAEALAGIDLAYFLIHSMEGAAAVDGGFAQRDRRAAANFAEAARAAGGRRVVYPGGPAPRAAPPPPPPPRPAAGAGARLG